MTSRRMVRSWRWVWAGCLALFAAVLLAGLWPVLPSVAQGKVEGTWAGGLDQAGTWTLLEVELTTSGVVTTGRARVRPRGGGWHRLAAVEVDGEAVRFWLGDRPWQFDGALAEGDLTGELSGAGRVQAVRLRRVADLTDDAFRAVMGPYELLPDGDPLFVGMAGLVDARYYAMGDRQVGLFPVAEDTFLSALGETIIVGRDGDGTVTALTAETPAGEVWTARRGLPYHEEAVRFVNGEVTLAGSVLIPVPGPGIAGGSYPAVLFTQGSGPETRERRRALADAFARNGVVALIYDKRGTGESTGNWYAATFDDLVGDALAAWAYTADRPETSADQVGLWGLSQGGWIVPLAAAREPDVAFAITVSAAGMSPAAQELYRWRNALAALGYEGAVLDAALKGVRLLHDLDRLDLPGVDDLFLGIDFDHDPLPVLSRVRQPLLAIWGAADAVVPARPSAAAFEGALEGGGNADVTLRIYDGAGHSLSLGDPGGVWEAHPEGYVSTMVDWVLARTGDRTARSVGNGDATVVAAHTDAGREVAAAVRPPWFGRAGVQLGLMAALVVVFASGTVAWAVMALVRWRRRLREEPGAEVPAAERGMRQGGGTPAVGDASTNGSLPLLETTPDRESAQQWAVWIWRFAHVAGLVNAGLVVSFVAMLVQFLMSDDAILARYYADALVRGGAALAGVAAVALPIAVAVAYPRAALGKAERVHLGMLALAALAMAPWLLYWRLLGL